LAGIAARQRVRLDGREDAGVVGAPEAPGVDGDDDVGGAVRALAEDALDEFVRAGLDEVDLDPGRLGEGVEQGRVGVVVTRGVDVDDPLRAGEPEQREEGDGQEGGG
jgi:hypothetical protein